MARRLRALSVGRLAANVGARCNGFNSVLVDMGVQSAGAGVLMPAAVQTTRYMSQAVFAVAERVQDSYSIDEEPQQRSAQLPSPALPPKLDFDDARSAFARHSSAEMLRSMGVFSLCSVKPLVRNADAILAYSKGVCGDRLVDAAIKRTLFSHFCAGENPEEMRPLMARLRASGIGSILAYSVESDANAVACDTEAAEAQRDRHLQKLVESVWAAQTNEGRGFAAVKVTALAQPCMLEAVSRALTAGRPLAELSDRELVLMDATVARLTQLARAAHKAGVRLMIDAEHSYFQPAIDLFALELQRHFNINEAVVLNTFQAYRKDTHQRLMADMARAEAEGWHFGAKIVRGAYLVLERQRAAERGYDSPIQDSKAATDANYDRCVAEVLHSIASGSRAEVMVAGHNFESVQAAVAMMQRLGLPPQQSGVYFGQLLGMSDALTYTLGNSSYQGYKYLPYGPIGETMPYLIRRAQENSDIMSGVGNEVRLLRSELWRRLAARLPGRGGDAGMGIGGPAPAMAA